jgi:hypothetical protein
MAIVLHSYLKPENLTVTFALDVGALLTGRQKLKRWGTGILIDFGTSLTNQFISLETAFNSVNNTDFEAGHCAEHRGHRAAMPRMRRPEHIHRAAFL